MSDNIDEYIKYHVDSSMATDIDPQVEALQYISEHHCLSMEQKYWICFLFSTCYCVGTAYLMFMAFPEFTLATIDNVDAWWKANRQNLLFQTDRRWVRSRNQWPSVIGSYRQFVAGNSKSMSQQEAVMSSIANGTTPAARYEMLLKKFKVEQFGRFAMFLYTDLLCNVCNVQIGVRFDIREADSSRNGLALAMGRMDLYTGRKSHAERKPLTGAEIAELNKGLMRISQELAMLPIKPRHKTMWSIETCLCAYRKWKEDGRRWVGYYVERYVHELDKLKSMNPTADLDVCYGFASSLR